MKKPLTAKLMLEVRARMTATGISVVELGKQLGLKESNQLYPWLKGTREPRAETLLRLRAWLDGDAKAIRKSKHPTKKKAAKT